MDDDHSTASAEPGAAGLLGNMTIGARLRLARQERGLELADVARETRVPMRFLTALERDDQAALPALPYTLGFVRACAKLLGLDPEAAAAQYKEERPVAPAASHQVTLDAEDESQLPSGRLVAFAITLLVLIVVAALIWRSLQSSSDNKVAVAAEPAPAATSPVLSNSAAPPVGTKPAVAPPPVATSTPGNSSAAGATVPAADSNPPVTTPPAPTAPAPTASRIILQAQADSWIKVTGDDGKTIKIGILKAGTSYTLPNLSHARLFTGNAGGLDVIVDGKHMPSLGQTGELVHVDLTPQGLSSARPNAEAKTDGN